MSVVFLSKDNNKHKEEFYRRKILVCVCPSLFFSSFFFSLVLPVSFVPSIAFVVLAQKKKEEEKGNIKGGGEKDPPNAAKARQKRTTTTTTTTKIFFQTHAILSRHYFRDEESQQPSLNL